MKKIKLLLICTLMTLMFGMFTGCGCNGTTNNGEDYTDESGSGNGTIKDDIESGADDIRDDIQDATGNNNGTNGNGTNENGTSGNGINENGTNGNGTNNNGTNNGTNTRNNY